MRVKYAYSFLTRPGCDRVQHRTDGFAWRPMRESPIERIARDARILSIAGGATEVMLEVVASTS